ncbi:MULTISPECIES: rod shape-determining protein MreC [unclassified Bacillus (in: firmicutes)]|jgi:rod shape-determining protein MreC|uniref:rod shape-determining protein MreC n=1 Tax=unclassified Bacillus (in: firmicutes) TaxID=185979 RepID=UPI00080AE9EE|nr:MULTISPECIES: rod shape-determining protein MreC [unclassified Bacillus (in: firmicutes)]OCA86543.1 rod shape-determining protein MreC [Bacillus sp. FJAT-27986]
MPQFFLNKKLIILLISIIFLVALIGFSLRERDELSWPEQFMKDSAGFVQTIFHKPASAVAGFFENLSDLRNTYEENKNLKSRLEEYVKLETEIYDLKKENEELSNILKKKEDLSDHTVSHATVIGRGPERWHETLTVSKGSVNGIEKNMAVITAEGLIGKVKSVSQFTSTVQLMTALDPQNRISAMVQSKEKSYGFIQGYDEDKQALLLTGLHYDAKIKKGENVTTSGLGGVFPEGLVIGTVKEVVIDQYGLTQTALVKPAANFYDLNNVMIVKRTMTTVDTDSTEGDDL